MRAAAATLAFTQSGEVRESAQLFEVHGPAQEPAVPARPGICLECLRRAARPRVFAPPSAAQVLGHEHRAYGQEAYGLPVGDRRVLTASSPGIWVSTAESPSKGEPRAASRPEGSSATLPGRR